MSAPRTKSNPSGRCCNMWFSWSELPHSSFSAFNSALKIKVKWWHDLIKWQLQSSIVHKPAQHRESSEDSCSFIFLFRIWNEIKKIRGWTCNTFLRQNSIAQPCLENFLIMVCHHYFTTESTAEYSCYTCIYDANKLI